MTEGISLRGVFPPIPTPFDDQGNISLSSLIGNLERWNKYDLSGYVVLGSNGEGGYLSTEEKVRVWHTARRAIPAGKLLIAGAGCESTRQTIATTQLAAEAGADAVLLVTPHYYGPKMTPQSLVQHYQTVAEAVSIPVLIYTVPKFTHVDMDAKSIAEAGKHPNIIGIKDTSGNIAKMADTVRRVGGDIQVLAGSAGFFLAGLAVGAVGGILALANIAPDKCLELYRLAREGNMEEAAELQRQVVPVNSAVTARFGIAGLKVAMEMLGYYGGPVRSPLQNITPEEREELEVILAEGGII